MWSWDVKEEMRICEHNGNLVVRFTDYITGKPFYSFLGDNNVEDTVTALLLLSKIEGIDVILKLIPEHTIEELRKLGCVGLKIEEDRDNFDYIYDVENLVQMSGGKFATHRKHVRFFEKNNNPIIKDLDINDVTIKSEIINLFGEWRANKSDEFSDEFENEFKAFARFLTISENSNHKAIGIYSQDKLLAVSLVEHVGDIYHMDHFQKTLTSIKGINPYLMNTLAKMLHNKNIKFLNCEQDLGLPGLRENKESYIPIRHLKKYVICFDL